MTDDWHTEDFPELRPHPPWVMQEMIEAEPALLEQIATASDTAPRIPAQDSAATPRQPTTSADRPSLDTR